MTCVTVENEFNVHRNKYATAAFISCVILVSVELGNRIDYYNIVGNCLLKMISVLVQHFSKRVL